MDHESVEVKDTPIGSEPYVNPLCEVLLCLSEHHSEKDCEERWCEDTSLFDAVIRKMNKQINVDKNN